MHPVLEKVTPSSNHSFALKEDILPHIEIGWHVHPEFELTLIAESEGKRVVGDHVDYFDAGDLLLIGPNLPHYMRNDKRYYEGDPSLRCRAIVVHFSDTFLGEDFFDIPEFVCIRKLLHQARRGLHIYGDTRDRVAEKMEALLNRSGYPRLMTLLDILHLIAMSSERTALASVVYAQSFPEADAPRISQVFEYLLKRYTEDISLADVAEQINMSRSAFCKYFKNRTGKTFSQLLNEIRVGHACKLLVEEDLPVTQVCYRSGYNTPSYFNRKFKSITGYTPLEYRKKFYVPVMM